MFKKIIKSIFIIGLCVAILMLSIEYIATDGNLSVWSLNGNLHWNKQFSDGKLSRIFKETGTDKLHTHHYNLWYEVFLAPYRDLPIAFLEIGAETGKSIKAWNKYFTKANLIQGVSYGQTGTANCKLPCKIVKGNQNDPKCLQELAKTNFDVIIDDGSHVPEHQIRSFIHLFPSLLPGGLYMIEDVFTSYWPSPNEVYGQKFTGSGIGKTYPGNIVGLFADLYHIMNRKYYSDINTHIIDPMIDFEIAAIMFAPDSILIFKKDVGFPSIGRPAKELTNEAFISFVRQASDKIRKFVPIIDKKLPWNEKKIDKTDGTLSWNKRITVDNPTSIFMSVGKETSLIHHYYQWYEVFFSPYRNLPINFLEIGALDGRTIKHWSQYFLKAKLVQGVLKEASNIDYELPCKIVNGDQSDPKFLQELAKTNFDVIINSGLNVPAHQIRCFIHLFPSLKPGGLYVIENIETSYWRSPNSIHGHNFEGSGIGKNYPGNIVGLFMDLYHIMNRKYYSVKEQALILDPRIDFEIATIMFVPNAILIFKKDIGYPSIGRLVFKKRAALADFQDFLEQARNKLKKIYTANQ